MHYLVASTRFSPRLLLACLHAAAAVGKIYTNWPISSALCIALSQLGVQIRNMKMVFNTGGTWRRVTFETLMMKIDEFF